MLHLFSGPGGRIDGLRAMMWDIHSIEVVEIDTLIDDVSCDMSKDRVHADLLARIAAGEFFAAIIGTPCGTFSVARIRRPDVEDDGPPQLRAKDSDSSNGRVPGLSMAHQDQVRLSDVLVQRSVEVARAIRDAGGVFIIENPITRSDPEDAEHFRWVWRSHYSLWMHPAMRELAAEADVAAVKFPQCALDGNFQKWTQLLYSSVLEPSLGPLGKLVCTHGKHALQAKGRGPDGKWRSADAAAYPAAMNAVLADACVRALLGAAIHVGSSRPHASAAEADAARPVERPAPTASSIRRLEPEVDSVLLDEPMPAANVPPVREWAAAPAADAAPPPPRRTDDLIPRAMQKRLADFRRAVGACFDASRRGRWKWARDHRPEPLFASEAECLFPGARGWTWAYSLSDHLWHAVQPSSWPDDPPDGEIEAAVVVQYAKEHGYTDMEIISYMAHGYPGPSMPRDAVLGPPHVGALKEPEAFFKMAKKDREHGWVEHGYALPPVWPMRADPMNIVFRNGKPRMTIDKTMELIQGVLSYNGSIDLDALPSIDYVTVSMLGRATAILMLAGVSVKVWGFDLEAYFRKTPKQRRDVWMSGFVHHDGFGVDKRVQFGQREAPVLTGRQSCFIVWAIRRELRRLDGEYKSVVPGVINWLQHRAGLRQADESSSWWQYDALFYVLMFVDDVGGASIDDVLLREGGDPWSVLRDGERVRMTRAWLHYEAAVGIIKSFGHTDAEGKGVTPHLDMVYLGVTIDVGSMLMSLSNQKCEAYGELVRKIRGGRPVPGGYSADAAELSSLIHKLLHASSVVAVGRQHMFHLLRAHRAVTRLPGGMKVVGKAAEGELEWWETVLASEAPLRGIPFATRSVFPDATEEGVLAPYSDASRELTDPEASGFGAWAVIFGVFVYVEGRWLEREVLDLNINVLELAAMNIGSFTFIAYAKSVGMSVTHLFEFTDNTAAEHSTERGKPKSIELGELVRRRYDALYGGGVSATAERVASVDNDIADGLSRGGSKLTDALRMASAAGYKVLRLQPLAEWRDLSALFGLR